MGFGDGCILLDGSEVMLEVDEHDTWRSCEYLYVYKSKKKKKKKKTTKKNKKKKTKSERKREGKRPSVQEHEFNSASTRSFAFFRKIGRFVYPSHRLQARITSHRFSSIFLSLGGDCMNIMVLIGFDRG